MLNPFTVGIARSISGIPVYSGIVIVRTVTWFITTSIGTAFLMVLCNKNQEKS